MSTPAYTQGDISQCERAYVETRIRRAPAAPAPKHAGMAHVNVWLCLAATFGRLIAYRSSSSSITACPASYVSISYVAQGQTLLEEIRAKLYPACPSRSELPRISQILYPLSRLLPRRSLSLLSLSVTPSIALVHTVDYRLYARVNRRFDPLAWRIYHVGYLAQV